MDSEDKATVRKVVRGIIYGVATLIVLGLIFGSFTIVPTGSRGVVLNLGRVTRILDPGIHFKIPFIESVDKVNVQTQKEQADAEGASSDLQEVQTTVAVNYNINPAGLQQLYQNVGVNFGSVIIDPAIQEVVKATTAKYTAEELITKRDSVRTDIQNALADRLAQNDIIVPVNGVSIVSFAFSNSFNQAIEEKVTAQQNALTAQNELVQSEAEASKTIITAKAQAEAIQIQAQAIQQQGGEAYVQLQAVKQWDGHLPQYMTGTATPFLNLK